MSTTNTDTVAKTAAKITNAKKAIAAKKATAKKGASKGKAAKSAGGPGFASLDLKKMETKRVKLLVDENPKRGASAKRFAQYKNNMTVAAALEKGVTTADIRWDVAHKFITLH